MLFIIIHSVLVLFSGGKEGGHWDEALVAMVATQCCWKLGDTAELQPSLWHGLFSPSSPSKIHALLLLLLSDSSPNRLQHSWEGAPLRSSETGAVNAAEGGEASGRGRWSVEDWPWSTLVMWLRRSVKNSGTPSYPVKHMESRVRE